MKKESGKIQEMFSAIAPRYDFLNTLLSLGVDRYWRNRAVRELLSGDRGIWLDIAAGTGDVSLNVAGKVKGQVVGLDFSFEMLRLGFLKTANSEAGRRVMLTNGDALSLPLKSGSFDGVICAFGVRNFVDVPTGISEMKRVLKPGGKVVILEFSEPRFPLFKSIFELYFKYILPVVGGIVSGRHEAYKYLHDSVGQFNRVCGLSEVMKSEGLISVRSEPLTFGISSIYSGYKKEPGDSSIQV